MISCYNCQTSVSERAMFCHSCGLRTPASYANAASTYNVQGTYNVQADLVQQSLGLLSRLWPALSTQEKASTIYLLLYAVQGYPSAVQGLRGWFANRSRYDTRSLT